MICKKAGTANTSIPSTISTMPKSNLVFNVWFLLSLRLRSGITGRGCSALWPGPATGSVAGGRAPGGRLCLLV